MRRYLIMDKMEKLKMTKEDVANASEGLLSYDMVVKQLQGKNLITKDSHIMGYINALKLTDKEVATIFFDKDV